MTPMPLACGFSPLSAHLMGGNGGYETCDVAATHKEETACVTPRGEVVKDSVLSSPRTPRAAEAQEVYTPPPLVPNSKKAHPGLLTALQRNCIELVRETMRSDPGLASEPFWEHNFEAPLCCAIRCKCDIEIIQLLIEHGAKPQDMDPRGNTPAKVLQKQRPLPSFELPPQPGGQSLAGGLAFATTFAPAPWMLPHTSSAALNGQAAGAEIREGWCQQVEQLLQLHAK